MGIREVVQQLRVLAWCFCEGSKFDAQITTSYQSSSNGPDTIFGTQRVPTFMCVKEIDAYVHKIKVHKYFKKCYCENFEMHLLEENKGSFEV